MRGTLNEGNVLLNMRTWKWVDGVFESGLLSNREFPYLACSSDGIAAIDAESLGFDGFGHEIACVEVKTAVAHSVLEEALSLGQIDAYTCVAGDEMFSRLIPDSHKAQVVYQAVVIRASFCVYVRACETGVVYKVVVYVPKSLSVTCWGYMVLQAGCCVQ